MRIYSLGIVVCALALAQNSPALEMYTLTACDGTPSTATVRAWCLGFQTAPDRKVSILGSRICEGKTGQSINLKGEEDEHYIGTQLNLKCNQPLDEETVALIDATVTQYRKAKTSEIQRSAAATRLRKRVESTPEFKKRSAERDAEDGFTDEPVWHGVEIRFSSRTLYAISSEKIRYPSFLVGDNFKQLWGENGVEYSVKQAFELNGTEFIEAHYCVAATDNCGGSFLVGPKFESHAFEVKDEEAAPPN